MTFIINNYIFWCFYWYVFFQNFSDILNDAENDTAIALGDSRGSPENTGASEVRTRRTRQPRPKSAHLNIGREREFTFQGSSLLTNGDLEELEKDITISSESKNGNENDALLRRLRALWWIFQSSLATFYDIGIFSIEVFSSVLILLNTTVWTQLFIFT